MELQKIREKLEQSEKSLEDFLAVIEEMKI